MEVVFKGVRVNKDNKHILKYFVVEQKGDVEMKSNLSVNMEDAEMIDTMPYDEIIVRGQEIARREYNNR